MSSTRMPLSRVAILASHYLGTQVDRQGSFARVRPQFLEPMLVQVAKRVRWGWSVTQITLWLRFEKLREPHPVAERRFVAYVAGLLAAPTARPTTRRAVA